MALRRSATAAASSLDLRKSANIAIAVGMVRAASVARAPQAAAQAAADIPDPICTALPHQLMGTLVNAPHDVVGGGQACVLQDCSTV